MTERSEQNVLPDSEPEHSEGNSSAVGDAQKADGIPAAGDEKPGRSVLERLCQYYLACIQFDFVKVSVPLTSWFGDLDYAELSTLPESADALKDSYDAINMLRRKSDEKGRFKLFLGYPTALYQTQRHDSLLVQPMFLFPVEHSVHGPVLDLSLPTLNREPIQRLTGATRERLVNELVEIEQEVGIGASGESPSPADLGRRLQRFKREWPWREQIDPAALSGDACPIADVKEPGLHNRAVLIASKGNPFTAGLEQELGQLAGMAAGSYRNTPLHHWLTGAGPAGRNEAKRPETGPLLEVLPMNTEQRQAVQSALTRSLTVITGPPGTGKSQVVSNILVNAAWSGKRILFASKNNRAVEIVETRVNGLGPRRTLVRLGSQRHYLQLTEGLIELMSAACTQSDIEDFDELRHRHDLFSNGLEAIDSEERNLIKIRNEVDRLEQDSEYARQTLSPETFASPERVDTKALRKALIEIEKRVHRADRQTATWLMRLKWPAVAGMRLRQLRKSLSNWAAMCPSHGFPGPPVVLEITLDGIRSYCGEMSGLLDAADKASEYRRALSRLQDASSLEDLARRKADMLGQVSSNSTLLWSQWLKTQPSRIRAEDRVHLGRYKSMFQMLSDAKQDGPLASTIRKKFRNILSEFGHFMPCWAVTNLSARGRIPFEPGVFDIVVFDEASQCDIPSAMPLLFRAKSAVVIGDSRQLSHISGLRHGQDQALLERFDLLSECPEWAYSYQSLFDLASVRAEPEAIISLVDHHRSHADIVGFSNREFYGGRLRIATRYDGLARPVSGEPGIRWIDVRGQTKRLRAGSACNMKEVDQAVEILRDLTLNKGYSGSIGFVTPFSAQAKELIKAIGGDTELSARLDRAGFLADTVHSFQGDERDVMLFSSVLSSGCHEGAKAFLRNNQSLFNVAITRARAQLIVVGDRDACLQSDIGYLSRFAEYSASLDRKTDQAVQVSAADLGPAYPKVDRPETVSDWERELYTALFKAGLKPIPQHPVEKYTVDFLVSAGRRQLVIEVDGERYHRNWTGELCRRDQMRNQRLFELGFDVMRFWVYEIRDDLSNCVRKVKAWTEAEDDSDSLPKSRD